MALADLDLPAELTDLAIAAGVIAGPDGELNPAFFADPGASLGKALTDPVQRTALLRLAQRLLDETGGRPPVETDPGTQWVPLAVGGAGNPPSGLYLVVTTEAPDTVVLGVGGMVRHAGPPEVSLTAQLPLVRVAASQSPVFLVGGSDGSLELELDLTLDDGVAAGPLELDGVAARVVVPTDGGDPSLVVRLRMPPDGDAGDIVLDTAQPLGEQALSVVIDLLTRAWPATPPTSSATCSASSDSAPAPRPRSHRCRSATCSSGAGRRSGTGSGRWPPPRAPSAAGWASSPRWSASTRRPEPARPPIRGRRASPAAPCRCAWRWRSTPAGRRLG